MSAPDDRTQAKAEGVAREAARYLEALDVFAALGVDPHALARAKATRVRADEHTRRARSRPLR
jgi:kynurenine formamidase